MSNRIKVVLAAPGDTDPPAHPLYTQDNMLAVNPPDFEAPELPTPYDYGAKGDGTTDDTVAVQAWLDAIQDGTGYGKAGTFIISATLTIGSNTTIWGAGKGQFILKTKQGIPQDFNLLNNKHIINAPSTPIDENIFIYGTQFCGDPVGTAAVQYFINFAGISHFILRDCLFQHHRRGFVLISNLFDYTIDNCEFTDWGDDTPPANPGEWAGGAAIFGYTACYDGSITNNHVHDGRGQGIWLPGQTMAPVAVQSPSKCMCANNLITNVVETGLVGAPSGTTINGNVIINVSLIDVSGHGMELHGADVVVSNNFIQQCGNCCISYSNPVNVTITGNVLDLPSQSYTGTPPHNVHQPALSIAAQGPGSGEAPGPTFENLVIQGNIMSSGDSLGGAPIQFGNGVGVGYEFCAVQCYGNDFGRAPSVRWQSYPNLVEFVPNFASVAGDQFVWGHSMQLPYEINFTIAGSSSGTITKTGIPFRPTRIEFYAVANDTTKILCSTGSSNSASGGNTCIAWSTDGTDYRGDRATDKCIWIMNPNSGGTDILKAYIASNSDLTDDGFILTITGTSTAGVQVNAVCYP